MSKIIFGDSEVKNPILKVLVVCLGIILAIAAIVFIVLPVLGVVLGFTVSLLLLIAMALVLAIPLILLVLIPLKFGHFNFSHEIDEKNLLETTANFGDFDLSNIKEVNIFCRSSNLKVIGCDRISAYAAVEGVENRFKYATDKDSFNLVFKQKEKINITIELPKDLKVNFYMASGTLDYKNLKGFVDANIGAGNISGENLVTSTKIKLGAGNINLAYIENNPKINIDIKLGAGKSQILIPKDSLVNTRFKSACGKLNSSFVNSDHAHFDIKVKSGAGNLDIMPA